MGAALALAIMLVVVVGILSLAVNAQGPFQGGAPAGAPPRPGRSSHPGAGPTVAGTDRPVRRPQRDRSERSRERQSGASVTPPAKEPEQAAAEVDQVLGDLKPLNSQAQALVISVVDERTLGPVTRSRLTLRVEPPGAAPFEVTTRVAFPTPEDRARIKVGATIPVRYDSNDHRRVVVDVDKEPGD